MCAVVLTHMRNKDTVGGQGPPQEPNINKTQSSDTTSTSQYGTCPTHCSHTTPPASRPSRAMHEQTPTCPHPRTHLPTHPYARIRQPTHTYTHAKLCEPPTRAESEAAPHEATRPLPGPSRTGDLSPHPVANAHQQPPPQHAKAVSALTHMCVCRRRAKSPPRGTQDGGLPAHFQSHDQKRPSTTPAFAERPTRHPPTPAASHQGGASISERRHGAAGVASAAPSSTSDRRQAGSVSPAAPSAPPSYSYVPSPKEVKRRFARKGKAWPQ